MYRIALYALGPVQQEPDVDTYRSDGRVEAQARAERLRNLREVEVLEVAEHVSRVREDRAAKAPVEREAQLVVDDEQNVAADRLVRVRVARARLLEAETAQRLPASREEPLADRQPHAAAVRVREATLHGRGVDERVVLPHVLAALVLAEEAQVLVVATKRGRRDRALEREVLPLVRVERAVARVAVVGRREAAEPN